METKKIAIACFVGAAIGTGVAVIVIPLFWWLGMLAGFGTGYLCYDLKEIREKAPLVWQLAKRGRTFSLAWLRKPHPIFWPWLVTFGISTYFIVESILRGNFLGEKEKAVGPIISMLIVLPFIIGYAWAMWAIILIFLILGLASIGAKRKKIFWQPSEFFSKEEVKKMIEKDYQMIPPTCRNIYALALTGFGYSLLTALQTTPKVLKKIGIGLWQFLCFIFYGMWVLLGRFLWYLLKLIHSQKRVLCGFDSAIGVAVAVTYILLGAKAVTPGQQIMVVICGGLIGAVVGVLNYEIISKRLLHLVPMTNKI